MSRWKAAGIHLLLTLLLALLVGALLFGVWYPPPYFGAGGADRLMLVLVCVDLTVGPLLTLIVFKAGKRGMKFDLAVIAFLQLLALGYGLHVMARSRPVFLVAAVDRFMLVPADAIRDADLAKGPRPEFRRRSWSGAVLAGAMIGDAKARENLVEAAMGGRDIDSFPEYYVPYEAVVPELLKHAKPLDALKKKPGAAEQVDAWLHERHRTADTVVWAPVVSRAHDLSMLLDKSTGQPLQALAIDPW